MKKSLTFFSAVSLLAATSAGAQKDLDEVDASIKKEKCFGIAKAGKNDCGAADGSHACAGYSKKDGMGFDWILLPAGVCDRIVDASLKPDMGVNQGEDNSF